MTERLRAVLDTNVFVSGFLSRNPTSPSRELLHRWLAEEFILIMCRPLLQEVIAKLVSHRVESERIERFFANAVRLAEWHDDSWEDASRLIPADPDDDAIIACAVKAQADYLVTYDLHFDVLGGEYGGVKIVKALPFLWAVRGDQPPEQPTHQEE